MIIMILQLIVLVLLMIAAGAVVAIGIIKGNREDKANENKHS